MWHIIDCLHTGLPLDQDVYDAAAFSPVFELSEWWYKNTGITFDRDFFFHPLKRVESEQRRNQGYHNKISH
jgi:hypothetical protein